MAAVGFVVLFCLIRILTLPQLELVRATHAVHSAAFPIASIVGAAMKSANWQRLSTK